MEVLTAVWAVFLFCLACNLDTILLSMGFEVKGVHISLGGTLVIAAVTTAVTWLSLALGDAASGLLPAGAADALGGLVMAGIGGWFLLDYLRHPDKGGGEEAAPSRTPGAWGCVTLAAALAVNNAGVGVAAGMAGLGVFSASAGNFLITLAALPLGRLLGRRVAGRVLGQYALPLSGALLVVLGLWEILA